MHRARVMRHEVRISNEPRSSGPSRHLALEFGSASAKIIEVAFNRTNDGQDEGNEIVLS
jgi:hypothetical protein